MLDYPVESLRNGLFCMPCSCLLPLDGFDPLSVLQDSVPPVMAFHLGSLGFLTPFSFDNFQTQVTQVIEGKKRHRRLACGQPRRSTMGRALPLLYCLSAVNDHSVNSVCCNWHVPLCPSNLLSRLKRRPVTSADLCVGDKLATSKQASSFVYMRKI